MAPKTDLSVFDALMERRAVRAFSDKKLDRAVVEQILALASRAPSGSNMQPWKVWVASGERLERLTNRMYEACINEDPTQIGEFRYYPDKIIDPYLSRRRKLGLDMYGLLGIQKGDKEAGQLQKAQNYKLFNAPVCAFVTIAQEMQIGMWLDMGGFMQSILLAAMGFGVDACPNQAISQYHKIIREELEIPDDRRICYAVAMGYEDKASPLSKLVSDREPVSSFTTFCGD